MEALQTKKHTNQQLTIKGVIPWDLLYEESKKEIKVKKAAKMVKRENLIYETNKYAYNFHQFETTKSFDKIFLQIKD